MVPIKYFPKQVITMIYRSLITKEIDSILIYYTPTGRIKDTEVHVIKTDEVLESGVELLPDDMHGDDEINRAVKFTNILGIHNKDGSIVYLDTQGIQHIQPLTKAQIESYMKDIKLIDSAGEDIDDEIEAEIKSEQEYTLNITNKLSSLYKDISQKIDMLAITVNDLHGLEVYTEKDKSKIRILLKSLNNKWRVVQEESSELLNGKLKGDK